MIRKQSPYFVESINQMPPEFRVDGEALHTVRQAVVTRWLDRQGLPASAFMALDGADYAEAFDRAQRVALRYLRLFGALVRGYAPDAREAGAVVEGRAVRVEVRTLHGHRRMVRTWVQGELVPSYHWTGPVREFADRVLADVFEATAPQRAAYHGYRPIPMLSAGV